MVAINIPTTSNANLFSTRLWLGNAVTRDGILSNVFVSPLVMGLATSPYPTFSVDDTVMPMADIQNNVGSGTLHLPFIFLVLQLNSFCFRD